MHDQYSVIDGMSGVGFGLRFESVLVAFKILRVDEKDWEYIFRLLIGLHRHIAHLQVSKEKARKERKRNRAKR